MRLTKNHAWIVLVVIVLVGIAILFRIPQSDVSTENENQLPDSEVMEATVRSTFAEAHITAVINTGDPTFSAYVQGPLQELCPFYIPDGITYRECLNQLVTREKEAYIGNKDDIDSFENFCQSISDPYTGVETLNLYLSCMAYKLRAV